MVFFIFFSNFNRKFCKQTVETLIRRRVSAASDLGLHCLPMSHKKEARLNWLNLCILVCASSNASDQPAHTRSLTRAFASRLNIL